MVRTMFYFCLLIYVLKYARIGEKFLDWTDKDPALDTILQSVTLYWLTDTISRSFYPYRHLHVALGNVGVHGNPIWYIHKPLGFSLFPKDLCPVPRSWIQTTGDLVFFREHSQVWESRNDCLKTTHPVAGWPLCGNRTDRRLRQGYRRLHIPGVEISISS